MRSRYVALMGICALPVLFGCSSDDNSNTTSGSAGSGGSSTTGGGNGGSGTATAGSGGGTTTGGGTGGSTGGAAPDASADGSGSCQTACDCPAGNGCFDNKCSGDLFAFCCGTPACNASPDALCQRPDKTFSTCGAAADGGTVKDFCIYFGCASGQMCPPGCMCGAGDMCVKM